MKSVWNVFLAVWFWLGIVSAFYLPGVAPNNYKEGSPIALLVNHLTPSLHHIADSHMAGKSKASVYAYDYYFPKFRFCKPKGGPVKQPESLGAIIFGDRIFNSPFEIEMLKDKSCQIMCKSTYEKQDSSFVGRKIRAGYSYNWIVDGLPAARTVIEKKTHSLFYSPGFPIGEVDANNNAYLYNHYNIKIEYHQRGSDYRVVGVTVHPVSLDRLKIDEKSAKAEDLCDTTLKPIVITRDKEIEVLFTYSVEFAESETAWATRWDKYLHVYDPKIQWVSLVNFSLVVIILATVIVQILVRALKNDIIKYNEVDLDADVAYDSGWKLVYGDVFRAPTNRMLLSVLVGNGVQLLCMALVTIVFALFGLLSPSNRGALSTFMFIFYILFSILSAYVSGYLYRFFGGENWKLNMILTPLLVPGIMFLSFVFLNFFLIFAKSSGAIPVGTMIAIVLIWFVISVPLSVFGSLWQSKRSIFSVPVRTNQIPRQIPKQEWYLRTVPAMFISGLFPFGSIAVELYFIFSSLWFNRIFYMFGFLFFCFVLMILITALISILTIYYTLCSENYKWQWKSYFVGGGCAIYVFLHSLYFLSDEKFTDFTSFVLYCGYSAIISLLVFVVCGSVGFLSNLLFTRKIYSQIKID